MRALRSSAPDHRLWHLATGFLAVPYWRSL